MKYSDIVKNLKKLSSYCKIKFITECFGIPMLDPMLDENKPKYDKKQNFYKNTENFEYGHPGTVRYIPDGKGTAYPLMAWQLIRDKSSNQYRLREKYGMNFDSKGFGIIDNKYVVAVTLWFGNTGDVLKVDFKNGETLDVVIGDIKNINDPNCDKYGHYNGKGVLEFIVDLYGGFSGYNGNKRVVTELPWLMNNRVTKIENLRTLSY